MMRVRTLGVRHDVRMTEEGVAKFIAPGRCVPSWPAMGGLGAKKPRKPGQGAIRAREGASGGALCGASLEAARYFCPSMAMLRRATVLAYIQHMNLRRWVSRFSA